LAAKNKNNALSEDQRLNRLRQQDGKPLLPPENLKTLFGPGGSIPEWKLDEAIAAYLAARKTAQQSNDFGAMEQVNFLTLALGNHFYVHDAPEKRRALFESSLEAAALPRIRQNMLGYLSRAAALEGDLSSAAQWLKPCDPRLDNLEADSCYRLSKATIDTAQMNWPAVLEVLGQRHNQIPIMDAMDPLAVVLRANALERSGRVEEAVLELSVYMGEGAASGRKAIEHLLKGYSGFNLCELSYPQAKAKYGQQAARQAAAVASGGIGGVMLVIGGGLLIGGLVGVYFLITGTGQGGLIFMGIPGLILFFMGLNSHKAAKKAARIRMHGKPATGTVVTVAPTGTRINNVRQYELTLSIQSENLAPYQAKTKMLIPESILPQIQPGAQLPVRVDPQNPQDFIVEGD
jgi:hypothetical protein